jgi:hypothetical protein
MLPSFAELPRRIEQHLLEFDRVVLIYLDAFGWTFLEQQGDHRLFRRAQVEKLTSQFPSTTTAHVTTIHTGLPVGAHGLYEWHVYEPRLHRLITPLPFSFAGDGERDTLVGTLDPAELYPGTTLYERLDVAAHVAGPRAIADSPSSRCLTRGATLHRFEATAEGLAVLASAVAGEERAYGTIYLPDVDTYMHASGPDDPAVATLFEQTLSAVDNAVFPEGALVLLTADHGMAAISPERSVYVNVVWPEIGDHLETGADGKPLAPAGSCRDLFLHARPDRVDFVVERLGTLLEDVAVVRPVRELVDEGLFGPVSEALGTRLANVVVLPYRGEAVYWLEPGRFEQHFRGQHGGVSREEMEIPLVSFVAG